MSYDTLVAAIESSRAPIVAAIESGDPTIVVPTCPELTLDELARHVGEFSTFWTHVVCEATGRPKTAYPDDPGPSGRGEWVDALITHLVAELGHATADLPSWTWHEPDQSAGFIASRACHELVVHRVDMQLAAGQPVDEIDPFIAAAGIDEVGLLMGTFGVNARRGTPADRGTPGHGETLLLHATDGEPVDWFVRLAPEKPEMSRSTGEADLRVDASPGDLELLLYQRPTIGPVQMTGERSVLDVFYGEFSFG